MSIQDDAFDIDNVLCPKNDDGESISVEKSKGYVLIPEDDYQIGSEAWDTFQAWAWSVEEAYDLKAKEVEILKHTIKIL